MTNAIYRSPYIGMDGERDWINEIYCKTCALEFVAKDEDQLVALWVRNTKHVCINEARPGCEDFERFGEAIAKEASYELRQEQWDENPLR